MTPKKMYIPYLRLTFFKIQQIQYFEYFTTFDKTWNGNELSGPRNFYPKCFDINIYIGLFLVWAEVPARKLRSMLCLVDYNVVNNWMRSKLNVFISSLSLSLLV